MKRRQFLQRATTLATFGGVLARHSLSASQIGKPRKLTAAIIGDTLHGRYGHGLEAVFSDRPEITLVAVADPSEGGRTKKRHELGAARAYADYHEMLEREKPDLVSVATRWTNQHFDMVTSALAAGAHVYCEKPFTTSLEEGDKLIAQAAATNRTIAVAHAVRLAPSTVFLKQQIDEGIIGQLRSMRINGKHDFRAGGEDMIVLGSHLFSLMRFFSGDPTEVTAQIRYQGKNVTRADIREPAYDKIGPVVGDDVDAHLTLPHRLVAHYTSRKEKFADAAPYSIEFGGSSGIIRMAVGFQPVITRLQGQRWAPLPGDPFKAGVTESTAMKLAQARVVDDWLAAIAGHREPVCSATDALRTMEIPHAIFTAGLAQKAVALPLRERRHPLA